MLDLLMDGLEELTLVFPHFGMVYLLNQLGVFVDQPCFPEYIGCGIFHLASFVIMQGVGDITNRQQLGR